VRESKIDARVEPTTAGPPTVISMGGGTVAGSRPDGGVMPSAVGPAAMGDAVRVLHAPSSPENTNRPTGKQRAILRLIAEIYRIEPSVRSRIP
jgi:hypothetical protein